MINTLPLKRTEKRSINGEEGNTLKTKTCIEYPYKHQLYYEKVTIFET